jgi:O-antigen ligase
MRNYGVSFCFLLLTAAAVPLAISTYFQSPDDLVKSVTLKIAGGCFIVVTLLSMLRNPPPNPVQRGKTRYPSEPLQNGNFSPAFDIPVLLFSAAAILSTIFSINPMVSFFGQYQRQIGLLSFLYIIIIYFLSFPVLRYENRVRTLFRVVEGAAVLVSIYAILQILGIDPFGLQPPTSVKRPPATFGNAIFLGAFLITAFPFSLLDASEKKNIVLRVLCPLVVLAGIVVSQTRSAYLALIAEIIFLVVFYITQMRKDGKLKSAVKYFISLVVCAAAFGITASIIYPENEFTQRLVSIANAGHNPRWILWRDSFQVFEKYPIFGCGVAMFPNAFEEFYSQELRWTETGKYFDHPHNNFIFILSSMGIIGLAAYLAIIIQGMRAALKGLRYGQWSPAGAGTSTGHNKPTYSTRSKPIFAAFAAFFAGYAVYGITNFDDISMMLYLFLVLGILKVLTFKHGKFTIVIAAPKVSKTRLILNRLGAVILIFLSGLSFYDSINELKADRHFRIANQLFAEGKFKESVQEMNTAIRLNNYCAAYKLSLAFNVYKYCTSHEIMPRSNKINLLNQVIDEVAKAKEKHYYLNECDGLLSLAHYEMGNQDEAERLRALVIGKDSVNVSYRLNLARYYVRASRTNDAQSELDEVSRACPKNVEVLLTAAFLNMKMNKKAEAIRYCEKVLELEPGNGIAKKMLSEVNKNGFNK